MNHLIRCYALSWHPTLWHMIFATQWLLQTHSSSVTLKAIQVVWTQMMATWGIWHIDEGFLVWIIPSTYQSHESIIWASTTSFVHTCIYRMLDISSHIYMYLCSLQHFLCMFFDSDLSIHMYLLDFEFTTDSLITIMLQVLAYVCMSEPHYLILYICPCFCTPLVFTLCTRWVISWQP